jgi:hypothetical protein
MPSEAEGACNLGASPAPRHALGCYSTLLASRIVRNSLKTNDRDALYSTLKRGAQFLTFLRPYLLASLPHGLLASGLLDTPCKANVALSH